VRAPLAAARLGSLVAFGLSFLSPGSYTSSILSAARVLLRTQAQPGLEKSPPGRKTTFRLVPLRVSSDGPRHDGKWSAVEGIAAVAGPHSAGEDLASFPRSGHGGRGSAV
jgi:hypothetical protein